MMRLPVLIGAAAVLNCYSATAQTPDSVPAAGKWYVGAGAGYHYYYSINRPYVRARPVYLMGGYTVTPKVSLQAEVQYGRVVNQTHNQGQVDGELYDFTYREETRSTAVTLLARFNRSQPSHHLQFDWLLGLAVVSGMQKDAAYRTSTTTGASSAYYYQPIRETTPHLVGGLGLRYLLGPHLSIGGELLISKNTKIPPVSVWGLAPGFGANLGVSYRFGAPAY
ncbi:outer membrane beta-barrel protein [Hymenobacter taeanensis]|uniref:Outer membrane beta-barrel protein n=1 Tax=Hymenobacter taeanensis TaxID=2735321 RepID=A0A6M6BCD2_9BACT|nr:MULTISPECIES: outer membrane beta-barrel protein [Hymenobacter]QJX45659.1 outer membrane beta-barrel protein [Hymenobacter taeanensis]UOQ79495.1 outer membrane beta-barrel protein [Hymenobacter sp. 5414T-23]